MPTLIAHHDVKDTEHWLASPKREEFFGPIGVTNIRTFVAAMQTEEAAAAMEHDGVLPETLVVLIES